MLKRLHPSPAAAALAALLAACGGGDAEPAARDAAAAPEPAAEAAAPTAEAPATDAGPVVDLPPNELGRIMVLEYHRLGQNEGEWIRSPENFQRDLQTLYEKGYRPITMRQVVEGNIDVPAGTTPVVFTFDDSSLGQFYYRPDGTIDPATMVGMWDAFQKANPSWKHGGVWCVLPGADHPSNFFGEKKSRDVPREQREADIRRKMEYLVKSGHEICNHTLYHARLDKGDAAQVQEWIGVGEDSLKAYLPADYDIVTLALPLGMWPKNKPLAWKGTYRDGKTYEYKAILEVSGGPSVSPYDVKFDPHSIDRFIVAPRALERQLEAWEKDPTSRYVSDGLPDVISVPQSAAGQVDRSKWSGKEVRTVQGAATAAPAEPAAGT